MHSPGGKCEMDSRFTTCQNPIDIETKLMLKCHNCFYIAVLETYWTKAKCENIWLYHFRFYTI